MLRKPSSKPFWRTPSRHPNIKCMVRTFFGDWWVGKKDGLRTHPLPGCGSRWIPLRILLSSSKNSRKNLIPTDLWLLFDLLSLKMKLQKVINKKLWRKKYFWLPSWRSLTKIAGSGSGSGFGSESKSVSQRYGSVDPDPYQNVTEPQHWRKDIRDVLIRDIMNRIVLPISLVFIATVDLFWPGRI